METVFDFEDGKGLVPAHRHRNLDGSVGGWVADTVSVDKTAYIGPNARVYGSAKIYDNTRIFKNARIYGNARVYGNACVYGNSPVYGDACVYDDAEIFGTAGVLEDARVDGNALVCDGAAHRYGDAQVSLSDMVEAVLSFREHQRGAASPLRAPLYVDTQIPLVHRAGLAPRTRGCRNIRLV